MGIYVDNRTLAAVTNGADQTVYYYIHMEPFTYGVIQCILNGGSGTVTVTLEATAEPSTAQASAVYEDITSNFGVSSITSSNSFWFDMPTPWRIVRVKVVSSTGGADDADWTIHSKFIRED